jgi:quinol monooxygenase YgiN
MSKVQFSAKFKKIDPANLDEFKKVAAAMIEVVKGESGNLTYDYFLSADETVCAVQESYRDSDAVLEHMAAMSDLLPRAVELGGGFEAECFGDPSPKLVEALGELPTYSFFQGK